MIGIVDYGMGNLHSVSKALERLNYQYFISENPAELAKADGLILPGVGSFKDAMEILRSTKLDQFLLNWAESGKPLLGICLGMQLLFEHSEENGDTTGLSLLKGNVRRFKGETDTGERYKVPHMGWNRLQFHQQHPLLENVDQGHVYFVHSYVVQEMEESNLLASSQYDVVVPAVVGKNNVLGAQFHPEKSSAVGMKLLENFATLVSKEREAKVYE
ncbi:imidazole glycerol phosphate synthase subunit HisH [Anaerobacillus alkaliphilus]|uniref:Imidazole glycerol phosphate synthase subunit HisH n=1 Tax=Anaerobacillus alkaliphilus TaxID=1548597 RepID=A0A4Q0VTI1_9BACI|nr:imidazole glycerol phosphate synthase subunit HisH [Anaerobacillus alkaliphilus]RXJ01733.1 imidazole glycerol phosphate synthase subunit HisH [Anaerobacillus alkaliphilus]